MTKNQIWNTNFVVFTIQKQLRQPCLVFFVNCDNNKNQNKEIWFLVFSHQLMQRKKICSQSINFLKLYFFPIEITPTSMKSDLIRVLALAAKHICVLHHFLTWNLMHAQWGKMFFDGEYTYLHTSIRSVIKFREQPQILDRKDRCSLAPFSILFSKIWHFFNGGSRFLPKNQEIIIIIYL